MSIILDALKKAQNKNKNQEGPSLLNNAQLKPKMVSLKFIVGLIAITVVAVILLFLLLSPRQVNIPQPRKITPDDLIKQIKEEGDLLSKPGV